MQPAAIADGSRTHAVSRQGVACFCAGVTLAEVDEAVAATPDATLASLGQSLGCGLQCGSCVPVLQEALGQVAWFAATVSATPITRCSDLRRLERLVFRVDVSLAEEGPYPKARPGQHVVLRAHTPEGTVERTYTVVAQDLAARTVTLGIRRNPGGKMTPWLLDAPQDGGVRRVEVSVPGGPRLGSQGQRPDVFFAAGIGVTPAVALANALEPSQTLHLHYSVTDADDAAFLPELAARREACPNFTFTVRKTSVAGTLSPGKIRRTALEFPAAKFHICGPEGYVRFVRKTLREAGVQPSRIHVELFVLTRERSARRTFRFKAYVAGAALAVLPFALLTAPLEDARPHGHPNVGHEQLQCVQCHVQSPASTRQALQAKVRHALGWRQTGAQFGMQAVTSATCIQCHANPDDRHPSNRFLEPRFEQARAETGAQLCVSCHREHSAARVTVAPTYCVSCHQDLKVKDDKASPTHDFLVRNKRWESCLQCHDFHGNHRWNTPLKLQDANSLQALERYLRGGPSPYGATVVKAKQGKAS